MRYLQIVNVDDDKWMSPVEDSWQLIGKGATALHDYTHKIKALYIHAVAPDTGIPRFFHIWTKNMEAAW